jgi:hypothetical protein
VCAATFCGRWRQARYSSSAQASQYQAAAGAAADAAADAAAGAGAGAASGQGQPQQAAQQRQGRRKRHWQNVTTLTLLQLYWPLLLVHSFWVLVEIGIR